MTAATRRVCAVQINADWRIVREGSDYCLEENGPFSFDWWIEVAGPGSVAYCRYAFERLSEGEPIENYDDWLGARS